MTNTANPTSMAGEMHHPQYNLPAPVAIAEPDKRLYFRARRVTDIIRSFIVLVLLSPLLLFIALLVKLDSLANGPGLAQSQTAYICCLQVWLYVSQLRSQRSPKPC